jgi:hypothetical protein
VRFFIIVLFSAFSLAAQANLNLKWLAPEPENQAIKQLLESSEVLQTSIDLINNNW